jgi:putative endonuclease
MMKTGKTAARPQSENKWADNQRAVRRRTERQRARRRGDLAEFLCRVHLRLRGWRIVARDWRCPAGEIDIVARRGKMLAVIEVKARATDAAAASSIAPRQRRRIARAASAFLLARPELSGLAVRFDVMLVAKRRLPRHLPGMWRADE